MATIVLSEQTDPLVRLPRLPGVYLMKDQEGGLIYIGKAKVLIDRVRSYFQKSVRHPPKTARMVELTATIDYIVTGSELEALILENNLIKKHRPRFNVILRDDKNYPFLRLSLKEAYPRLEIVRRVKPDGARYFGPYVPTSALRETLRLLRRIFPLPNCNIVIDGTAERPCIEYEIKRCLAPCTGNQRQADYQKMIDQVRLFLEGRDSDLMNALRSQMEIASSRLNFEEAARLRDQLATIERTLEKQRITSTKLDDRDVWAVVREHDVDCRGDSQIAPTATAVLELLFVRGGMVVGRKEFFFHQVGDPPEAESDADLLGSAIEQYYSKETVLPPEIVCPMRLEEQPLLTRWLTGRRGGRVTFRIPQRGHDLDLIKLAEENAVAALQARQRAIGVGVVAASQLQQQLGLRHVPRHIEAFDISNLAADQAVGSCVVWVDERFQPDDYRQYRIKQTVGPNDFGMMAEVVRRHYTQAKARGRSAPDLILIDGGKGQLSSAVNVLLPLGLGEADVIGLAKAKGEKFERVFLPDESDAIELSPGRPGTHLLQRIRDEAHRFAITYHRKLRGKALVTSVLDDIPGLGAVRKRALLRQFGSLATLRRAALEEIAAVKGMPKGLSRLVYEKIKIR